MKELDNAILREELAAADAEIAILKRKVKIDGYLHTFISIYIIVSLVPTLVKYLIS